MAKLEFVKNNKDPRFIQYPENVRLTWCDMDCNLVKRTSLVIINDGYAKCSLTSMVCKECMSEGYEIHSKNGRRFCAGWLGLEEGGWWEPDLEET